MTAALFLIEPAVAAGPASATSSSSPDPRAGTRSR